VRRAIQLFLVFVVMVAGFAAPSTAAATTSHRNPSLSDLLTELWTDILTAPADGNPFNGGDRCNYLANGRVLAPFGGGVTDFSCDVVAGTKIFVIAYSAECSDAELGTPYYGEDERSLRKCATKALSRLYAPRIAVDRHPVRISKVRTDFIEELLPADNLFGLSAGTPIKSSGLGWVTLVPPLSVGQHKIAVKISGLDAYGNPVQGITTTINVRPAGH